MTALLKVSLSVFAIMASLTLSNLALAAEHGYWVESAFCGEIDPLVVGDACVYELANEQEHLVVIMDYDAVFNELGGDYEATDVTLEKKGLRKASKKVVEVLKGLVPAGVKVYSIAPEFVRFEHLDGDR